MTTAAPEGGPTASKPTHMRGGPQQGILNRPPEHLLLAALDLTGPDPRAALEDLREILRGELTSTLEPVGDPATPSKETGELGFRDNYDRAHLTVTVGFSTGAYDKLGVAGADRPADLVAIPWELLGQQPPAVPSGDLLVQICADSTFLTEHVLRRIEHRLAGKVAVVWTHTGVQRYTSRAGRTSRREGRAWIGFLDGTSNLDPAHNTDDRALTFVDPDPDTTAAYPKTPPSGQPGQYGSGNSPIFPPNMREHQGKEPAWTRDGTYAAVRVTINDLAAWDQTPLVEQEQTIGRAKQTGVALDLAGTAGATDETDPLFQSDQSATAVALNAHIRKANPRGPGDKARRIFRRGYPLYEPRDGGLARGLVFICFARTLSTQFEFITRGWLNNNDFPHPNAGVDLLAKFDGPPVAGGYYFVPPLDQKRQPWSWHVPTAPSG